jgi:hypothetical protein
MLFLKIYLAGIAVLIAAVLLNLAAGWLNLSTWYSFLNLVSENGLSQAIQSLRFIDYIFLLLIYPGLLGLAAYLTLRLFP